MLTRFLLFSVFLALPNLVSADDSKALRQQRQEAQKQRQQQVTDRAKTLNEAIREFTQYIHGLKMNNRQQLKDLDTEFELRHVELKADHDARVASAEAEYQKKLPGLFTSPGLAFNAQTIEQLQAEARAFSDALFELKRQSAEEMHGELIANEQKKNTLLTESDQMALEKAEALGLTAKYPAILATPIGDGLTPQEQRWNERETMTVAKLEERNRKLLGEFRNGSTLRQWEIDNLNEDFKLAWDEKAEFHALESEQIFYNTLFMQPAQGEQIDYQKLTNQMAELNETKKLITIKYREIRDKNRITRREEKKAILAN